MLKAESGSRGPNWFAKPSKAISRSKRCILSESCRRDPGIQALLRQIPGKPEIVEVADRLFPTIVSTENPQGLMALARLPSIQLEKLLASASMLLVGCELQDPGNLGTLLRSAEAFGVEGVLLTQTSVSPLE